MEHLHHFNLTQDPFQNEPDLRFYVDSACHREVQLRVERGLRQCKGLCVLAGEGGTGKTLLARRILDSLEEEMFDANLMVMLAGAADAEAVLRRFARQVGVEGPSDDRSGLLAQLYEQLAIVREDGRHCVLILDDAHILSRDAMSEVAGLLNLEYEDRRLLSLLLVGAPELDVMLSHDPSLAARVDVRVHLASLDLANSRAYLAQRLAVVGGSAETFSDEAIDALFKFGRGRPRMLNTLADNALFETYLAGKHQVDGSHVERSAADLGVGTEPGLTYSGIPSARAATDLPAATPGAIASPGDDLTVVAELNDEHNDPNEDSALELCTVAAPGDDDVGLGSLLETVDDDQVDLGARAMEGGPRDLDLEMEKALAPVAASSQSDELPIFAAHNASAPATADATRIALDSPASNTDDGDEFEDLFVELIEE